VSRLQRSSHTGKTKGIRRSLSIDSMVYLSFRFDFRPICVIVSAQYWRLSRMHDRKALPTKIHS